MSLDELDPAIRVVYDKQYGKGNYIVHELNDREVMQRLRGKPNAQSPAARGNNQPNETNGNSIK